MERGESRGAEPPATGETSEREVTPAVPQPARLGMATASAAALPPASPPASPPDPDPEVRLQVDGVVWTVRLLGCSGTSTAPLLLVGFFLPEDPSEAHKQSFVVGRALEDLTELQLEAAWRTSIPHVGPGTRRPFFPEIVSRGTKDG